MRPTRLLIGPADPDWAARFLPAGDETCRRVDYGLPDWPAVAAGLPPGWWPDAVLVRLGYASVPPWVWACPAPVVALAHDPNLLWHAYRGLLPGFDLVLTDAPAAARLGRAGVAHARPANLYGLDHGFLAGIDAPDGDRDIDLLFVGNTNPAVQGERLRWLGRIARLADRCRVVIRAGVFGGEYLGLLRRAKLVFNRSIRGECNQRAFEAPAGGAVLLQEAENDEVPAYLRPDAEYVRYTDSDLEDRVAHYLSRPAERDAVAARGRDRVRGYGWLPLVRAGLAAVADWGEVLDRAARRSADPPRPPL
ncbi:MAG: glycosyltransferase, partial [Gemmataceae bacterium]|nr:glycosyltransferase [Gemmataceae bacterium]